MNQLTLLVVGFFLSSTLHVKASTGTFDSLYTQAWDLMASNPDSSEILGSQLLSLALKERNFEYAGKGAYVVAYANDVENRLLNAGMRYFESLTYLRKAETKDKELEMKVVISLGRINRMAGRTLDAIRIYEEALEICGDCEMKSMIHYNIGYAWYTIKSYDKALRELFEAYELSLTQKNYVRAINSLNYIGLCHHYVGNFETAREYYTRILDSKALSGEKYLQSAGWALHNMGFSYFEEGKVEIALHHYHEALGLMKQLPDSSLRFVTLMDIGEILLKEERYAESIAFLEAAARIYPLKPRNPETFKVFGFLQQAYKQADLAKYQYYVEKMQEEYEEYITVMDQFRTKNMAYEMQRLEAQITERIAQYEKIEKWMARAYLMAPIIIVLGIICFFLYQRKQKSKHREILKLISEV